MDQKDFLNIINSRRSVRNFTKEPVSKELIAKIIEIAAKAPSACNVQGWQFIAIDSEEIKQKLVDHGGSIVIKNASVGILALYDNRTKNTEYHDNIQSAAAGIENLLLAATYCGLGSCWLCHLPTKRQLRKIFSIPSYYDPIAYILLGYKQKEPVEVPRKYKTEDLVSYNKFRLNPLSKNPPESKTIIRKLLVKIYYLAPLFIKKRFLNKFLDKYFVKKFEN
jgi:nitroreductase